MAFALGELDEARGREIEAAAARRPDLARRIHQLRELLGIMGQGLMEAVPRETLSLAFNVWESERPSRLTDWIGEAVEKVMDRLFDSGTAPALAGFRGGSDSRHLSFRSGEVEIELLVETGSERATIQGQVVGTELLAGAAFSPGSEISVAQAGRGEDGGFRLELPAAPCNLRVRTGRGVFALPGVISE